MLGLFALIKVYELYSKMADEKNSKQVETERIDRIERKQEKHEERLNDHDSQIKDILFKIEQVGKKIDHLEVTLEDLNESFDLACQNAEHFHNAGNTMKEEQAKNRVRALRNQIHATELKLDKAKHDKVTFCEKLEVA